VDFPPEVHPVSPGSFNPASVSALLSFVVSAIAAACAFLLGRVPDWDDVRPLAWVAATAALVAGCNFTATLDVAADVYLWTGRLQVAGVALHVWAWHQYLPGWAGRRLTSAHASALWGLLAAGLLALLPGAVYGAAITPRPLPWLGVTYHDPVVTPLGALVYGVIAAYGVWGFWLTFTLGRAGATFPRAHLACTGAILLMAVHDALVVGGVQLPTPYLLDFAFYGPITVLGLLTLRRVGQSATDLRHLNAGLAALVAKRSSDLERSQLALARAERLAALGQFAAGVAHEVNNPAAVVAANLDYLSAELADDPRDRLWTALRDAQAGVGRITGLAHQLLVAGRSASRPETPVAPVHLATALEAALAVARARAGAAITFDAAVPTTLFALAHEDSLVQVLSNLLVNAVQAIPPTRGGKVTVRAEAAGDLVRLVVDDDGVGMSEEALLHLFEPFTSTKPAGHGTGLGLAVSLGLVTGMRGSLRHQSALGKGTSAYLELRRAAAPPAGPEPGQRADPVPPFRARILIVDDDEQVRTSFARMLGRTHDVFVSSGVQPGLEAIEAARFDLILCDVMMPGGGAERFWSELPLRAPWALGRVAFMTGGAATAEARAFLASQPQPVLPKPFDTQAVQGVLADLEVASRRARAPDPSDPPPDPEAEVSAARALGRLRRA
jgi:signal transduction histidine kinase/CheY-like chemotaxis protein